MAYAISRQYTIPPLKRKFDFVSELKELMFFDFVYVSQLFRPSRLVSNIEMTAPDLEIVRGESRRRRKDFVDVASKKILNCIAGIEREFGEGVRKSAKVRGYDFRSCGSPFRADELEMIDDSRFKKRLRLEAPYESPHSFLAFKSFLEYVLREPFHLAESIDLEIVEMGEGEKSRKRVRRLEKIDVADLQWLTLKRKDEILDFFGIPDIRYVHSTHLKGCYVRGDKATVGEKEFRMRVGGEFIRVPPLTTYTLAKQHNIFATYTSVQRFDGYIDKYVIDADRGSRVIDILGVNESLAARRFWKISTKVLESIKRTERKLKLPRALAKTSGARGWHYWGKSSVKESPEAYVTTLLTADPKAKERKQTAKYFELPYFHKLLAGSIGLITMFDELYWVPNLLRKEEISLIGIDYEAYGTYGHLCTLSEETGFLADQCKIRLDTKPNMEKGVFRCILNPHWKTGKLSVPLPFVDDYHIDPRLYNLDEIDRISTIEFVKNRIAYGYGEYVDQPEVLTQETAEEVSYKMAPAFYMLFALGPTKCSRLSLREYDWHWKIYSEKLGF